MQVEDKRFWARNFMVFGGIAWIAYGISHLFFPLVLNWEEVLKNVSVTNLLGYDISNIGYVYLFNADLFLFDIILGITSILLASLIREGKRVAFYFSIMLGIYFALRGPLQIIYFGTSILDLIQVIGAIIFAILYLFPLVDIKAFSE